MPPKPQKTEDDEAAKTSEQTDWQPSQPHARPRPNRLVSSWAVGYVEP
ncbi:MAG TPA: hypothetical protein VGA96_18605 [Fibrella sp.]